VTADEQPRTEAKPLISLALHPQQSLKSLLVKWLSLLLEVVHEEFGFADKVIMKCTDFQVEDRLEGSSALDSVRRTARPLTERAEDR
jgi:hypothetical protein